MKQPVNMDNIVEQMSKVGMNLEKRLAYIHSKNKAIKDENILMRCVYNQQYKDMDMFTSPEFLGLKPVQSESEESEEEKTTKPRKMQGALEVYDYEY